MSVQKDCKLGGGRCNITFRIKCNEGDLNECIIKITALCYLCEACVAFNEQFCQ
jgi:hypothetical protein